MKRTRNSVKSSKFGWADRLGIVGGWVHRSEAVVLVLMVVFFGLFYVQKQYFLTSDLGRHIKNGELILTQSHVAEVNLYSYTEPERSVANHHWLAGVVYYLLNKSLGMVGLHGVSILIYITGVVVAMLVGRRGSSGWMVMMVSLAALPIVVWRNEIRPEQFSYVLIPVYLLVLDRLRFEGWNWWRVLALMVMQVLWVNLHIYFVLGVVMMGLVVMEAAIKHGWSWKRVKMWWWGWLGIIGVNVFNPRGIDGVTAPLLARHENLVHVTETQSVFELLNHFDRMDFVWFVAVLGGWMYLVYGLANKRKILEYGYEELLVVGSGMLGVWMVRNMAVFGLVMIALGPRLISRWLKLAGMDENNLRVKWGGILLTVMIMTMGLGVENWLYSPFKTGEQMGLGVRANEQKPAEFIRIAEVDGPWYNNFDIGGYLIYHFYPEERVFIDNRPEAYSQSFFGEEYIKMHQDEVVWQQMVERYGFNALIATYRDNTTWMKPFLIRRNSDPDWVLVYQDENVVIFVRNTSANQSIIDQYQIITD